MMVPVAAVLCLAIGGPYLWLGYQHYSTFGGLNVSVQSVLLFLCINLVICLWELCLCYKHTLIRATHAKRVKDGQVRGCYCAIVYRLSHPIRIRGIMCHRVSCLPLESHSARRVVER